MKEINEDTVVDLPLNLAMATRVKQATKNREVTDLARELVEVVLEIPKVFQGENLETKAELLDRFVERVRSILESNTTLGEK